MDVPWTLTLRYIHHRFVVQSQELSAMPDAVQQVLRQEMTQIYHSMDVDPVAMNDAFIYKHSHSARHLVSGV